MALPSCTLFYAPAQTPFRRSSARVPSLGKGTLAQVAVTTFQTLPLPVRAHGEQGSTVRGDGVDGTLIF